MRKLILAAVSAMVLCLGSGLVMGQKDQGVKNPEIRALVREMDDVRANGANGPSTEANAVDPADVGEADSFGKNVKFLGTANAGVVYVYSSCDPAVLQTDLGVVLGPDDRCLAASNPLVTTSAQFNDIGRIKLPKNSADNLVYLIANHTLNYQMLNTSPNPFLSNAVYTPTVTIESDALNDPAAIDPVTGLPMNGSFTTGGFGSKTNAETLAVGSQKLIVDSYSRANTTGLSRQFFTSLGLPNNVVNKLFNKPMTIRLNVRVSVRLVTFGQFLFAVRAMGN